MQYICPICHKEFKSLLALSIHYNSIHKNEENFKIYWNYTRLGLSKPVCPYCGKDVVVNTRILHTCGSSECKHKYNVEYQKKIHEERPELKEKARERRIKYLNNKLNFENTAWGKKANNKLSFLEQWFVDNIIIPYKLYETFDIVNEYTVERYFLDFAFVNIKLDVELDGRCHFNNGNKRIEHDIERDKKLKSKNWNIYRISHIDVETNEKETVKNFIQYIKSFDKISSKKFDTNKYYTNNYIIINNRKLEKEKLKKEKEKSKQIKINNIINILNKLKFESGIDFTKFGWVEKSKQYLDKNNLYYGKNLRLYIKKYYPEFFDGINVFTRKHC